MRDAYGRDSAGDQQSGAADAPEWWVQRTLPPIPSAVRSRMLPVMEIIPSPMATESRTCGASAR